MIGVRFNFVLPYGISFYTFMVVGYILDIYGKDIEQRLIILN